MRNSSIGNMAWDTNDFRDAESNGAGGTYCANDSLGCNAWTVSDNFVNGTYSGTVLLDSSLNTYLNGTYKGTLNTVNVVDHEFSIGTAEYDNTDLAAQIASENSLKWTGTVGLMSMSDYIRSNTNSAQCGNYGLNNDNYSTCITTTWMQDVLTNSSISEMWTMTARSTHSESVVHVNSSGTIYHHSAFDTFGVAPVLYLSSNISLSGSGTDIDPYVIG